MKGKIFLVSDHTGITVEILANTLLTQLESTAVEKVICPYIDSSERLEQVLAQVQDAREEGGRTVIFSSLVSLESRQRLRDSGVRVYDLFELMLEPVAEALGQVPSPRTGIMHGMGVQATYDQRVEAMNYTLSHDDGVLVKDLENADIILIGASRCGKTPTCLYLALHYGIRAANYPLTEEDFPLDVLPTPLRPYREKLFGLIISPERLQQIREQRRPNSRYASLAQCRLELGEVSKLYKRAGIPYLDVTAASIEEIATRIKYRIGW